MDDIRELYNLIRADIKAIVKEAVSEAIEETFNSLNWSMDPKTNTVTFLVGNSEAKVNGDKK